jgi:hypothetical protein
MAMRKDDLYGLPLDEFTKARDAYAKELRQAGKKDAAENVKALRKPSVSAWAVNQAVRRRPQDAKALVKAGGELRKAQTETAKEALEERGAVSPSILVRVAQTLRGASIDKEASKTLTAGTLSEDVEQAGFGPLLAAVPSPPKRAPRKQAAKQPKPKAKPKPKPTPKPKADPHAARRRRLSDQLEKARAKVRELEEQLARLT